MGREQETIEREEAAIRKLAFDLACIWEEMSSKPLAIGEGEELSDFERFLRAAFDLVHLEDRATKDLARQAIRDSIQGHAR